MDKKLRRIMVLLLLVSFISSSIQAPIYAQIDPMPFMPRPGEMVHLSPQFNPAYLKGIVVHPEDPFKFDFIIYKGDLPLNDAQKKEEYTKLTKYFLASLAIPDDDQWVNLSPYEKDRIIKDDFGRTEMGRDLLAQDYMLKQITASLIYPEENLGKEFWQKVYAQAQKQYGTSNVPVNTFNKVWIVPDSALIYEKGNMAYVVNHHLKVMLEEDYLSLQKHTGIQNTPANVTYTIASKIVREIVLPELQREVNEDKNFAALRQVYSGMILAAWFKRTLKQSLIGQIYANKSKIRGVDQDPKTNQAIYRQYLRAYKKGVFNFIKEDVDRLTNETIPRKYFSGGTISDGAMYTQEVKITHDFAMAKPDIGNGSKFDFATVGMDRATVDLATVSSRRRFIAVAGGALAAARAFAETIPGERRFLELAEKGVFATSQFNAARFIDELSRVKNAPFEKIKIQGGATAEEIKKLRDSISVQVGDNTQPGFAFLTGTDGKKIKLVEFHPGRSWYSGDKWHTTPDQYEIARNYVFKVWDNMVIKYGGNLYRFDGDDSSGHIIQKLNNLDEQLNLEYLYGVIAASDLMSVRSALPPKIANCMTVYGDGSIGLRPNYANSQGSRPVPYVTKFEVIDHGRGRISWLEADGYGQIASQTLEYVFTKEFNFEFYDKVTAKFVHYWNQLAPILHQFGYLMTFSNRVVFPGAGAVSSGFSGFRKGDKKFTEAMRKFSPTVVNNLERFLIEQAKDATFNPINHYEIVEDKIEYQGAPDNDNDHDHAMQTQSHSKDRGAKNLRYKVDSDAAMTVTKDSVTFNNGYIDSHEHVLTVLENILEQINQPTLHKRDTFVVLHMPLDDQSWKGRVAQAIIGEPYSSHNPLRVLLRHVSSNSMVFEGDDYFLGRFRVWLMARIREIQVAMVAPKGKKDVTKAMRGIYLLVGKIKARGNALRSKDLKKAQVTKKEPLLDTDQIEHLNVLLAEATVSLSESNQNGLVRKFTVLWNGEEYTIIVHHLEFGSTIRSSLIFPVNSVI